MVFVLWGLFRIMGKWPSHAYYWPTDDLISASDAIKKRERDNRTGVIWCHAECYKADPQNGNALFARRGPGSPHFWLGTGSFTKNVECDFEVFKTRNSESYRYSQILHDLFAWLNTYPKDGDLGLISVEKSTRRAADLVLNHSPIGEMMRNVTNVLIRDKNRNRTVEDEITIVIDISRWPDSHIEDFENTKRLFLEELQRLNQRSNLIVAQSQKATANEKSRLLTIAEQREMRAHSLGISTNQLDKLRRIQRFAEKLIEKDRKEMYRELNENAEMQFGRGLSTREIRLKYIRKGMEKDRLVTLESRLNKAEKAIRRNNTERDTPKWPDNWVADLISFVKEKWVVGTEDLAERIESVHTALFDLESNFYTHLIKDLKSLRIQTVYSINGNLRYPEGKGIVSDGSAIFVWRYDEGIFFEELFDELAKQSL